MDTIKVEITVEIPEWTNWIAVDKNGEVYAYENKPTITDGVWDHMRPEYGEMELLYKSKPPKNWKTELYTWGY